MLQAEQQFAPALFAFAIAGQNRNEFFATICGISDQNQNALFSIGIILQPDVDVDSIGPDVNVVPLREVTFRPLLVFVGPLFFESDDDVGTEAFGSFYDQCLQSFLKRTSGDSLEVQPRNQLFDRVRFIQVRRQHLR